MNGIWITPSDEEQALASTSAGEAAVAVIHAVSASVRLAQVLAMRPSPEAADAIHAIGERINFDLELLAQMVRVSE